MRRWSLLLVLALLSSGCALQRQVPGTSLAWDARRGELAAIDAWDLRGRIAVKSGDSGGQGRIDWQQRDADAWLKVSGPFGLGAWEIRFNEREIVVTDGKGEVTASYSGPDAADRFLRGQLGWSFPAVSARYWLLGIPAPGLPYREQYDDAGWLVAIEQQGWSVRYDGFSEREMHWLPRKISVENDSGRLRLVMDDFSTTIADSP